jgi:predicted alpha/beta-fold hydrolase
LLAGLHPPAGPRTQPFQTVLRDPALGAVRLTGLLSEVAGCDTIVLIVHGLSGNALSPYCARAAHAAEQAGFSSLRLSLRGADFSGEDIFHGGTTEDLRAALAAPQIAGYRRVLLLGYSVGGHIALRAAVDAVDSRLRAAAAICPPLDLDAATAAFDHPKRRPYRRHIFRGLNKAYAAAAARGRAPLSPAVVERARSCRERDSLTVVVRFGFRSSADYYQRESVGPQLHRLRIPSLVVAARHDPMVPAEAIAPALEGASPALSVAWTERGGHVSFPRNLDLFQSGPLGLEPQVIRWLDRQ